MSDTSSDSCSKEVGGSSHPNGVEPMGCLLSGSGSGDVRAIGLGDFATLSDENLLQILELLSAHDLARLIPVSKALLCFASHEPLWKALTIKVSALRQESRCMPALLSSVTSRARVLAHPDSDCRRIIK